MDIRALLEANLNPKTAITALIASSVLLVLHAIGTLPDEPALVWTTWAVVAVASASLIVSLAARAWTHTEPRRRAILEHFRRLTWFEESYLYTAACTPHEWLNTMDVRTSGDVHDVLVYTRVLTARGYLEQARPNERFAIGQIRVTAKGRRYAAHWAAKLGFDPVPEAPLPSV